MKSSRHARAFLVVGTLAAAGCAAVTTQNSYLDRNADLTRYARYSWAPPDRTATGDPRLDNNEIVEEKIQAAVDRELGSRGFEQVATGSPDLLVHYHTSVEQRIDLRETDSSAPCEDCQPFIYEAGTLVIDLVDASTRQLVWRGWSEGSIEGVVDNQALMEARIDESVKKIFDRLPLSPG
jgi:hypothetical protein